MKVLKFPVALLVVTLASALLVVPSGVGAAAKSPWSGNAAAIAFYRTAVATTNALPMLQDVTRGDLWIWDNAYATGSKGAFYMSWSYAHRPASYLVAAESTTEYRFVGAKEIWYTTTYAPLCASGTVCVSTVKPLEIYVTRGGDFWGYTTGSTPVGCWNRASASKNTAWMNKDFAVSRKAKGEWRTYGHFLPMVTQGNQVLITSTYPNGRGGAVVLETDSINATTKLFTGSVYHVGRSTHPVYAPYSYTVSETDPTPPLTPPSIHLCG